MDLNRLYVNIFLLILLAGIMIYLFRPVIREGKSKKGKGNPFSKKSKFVRTVKSVNKKVAEGVSNLGKRAIITAKLAALTVQVKAILAKHGNITVPKCFFKTLAKFFKECETIKLKKLQEDKKVQEEKLKQLK